MADEKKHSVVVSPSALATMMLHAARHGTTAVHGILLGTFSDGAVEVTSAVPVCHEAPTKPLVDTALALVASDGIVGWYTAPERLQDTRPGAPALRIAENLASEKGEPVLMVLQNDPLAECLKGGDAKADVVKAYGKDFGQQWMEPLEVTLDKEAGALEAARKAYHEKVVVNDLVDHWEAESAAAEWYPSAAVAECVAKHC